MSDGRSLKVKKPRTKKTVIPKGFVSAGAPRAGIIRPVDNTMHTNMFVHASIPCKTSVREEYDGATVNYHIYVDAPDPREPSAIAREILQLLHS